jgi:RNA polymerase sigma factor (sigma-70 family)
MTALADNIIQSTIDRCDTSVLTRMDERRLFARLARGDKNARGILFEHNVRLVASISHRYERPAFSREEAFQEGCLGLLHAIDKFDLTLGTKFSTYATWWIKQHCQRAQHKQARMIRLPVHQEHFMSRVRRAEAALVTLLGRPVSPEEIAFELGEDPIDIASLLRVAENVNSLNAKVGDTETEFGDFLPDTGDEFSEVDDRIANEVLYEALDLMLDPRSREVIVRRWGLEGHQPQTLQAIADDFNLSRERVRQIEAKALVTLKVLCLWMTRDYATPIDVVAKRIDLKSAPKPKWRKKRKQRPVNFARHLARSTT